MLSFLVFQNKIEFRFIDFFSKELMHSESFSYDDSEQIGLDILDIVKKGRGFMHKKIMEKASKALEKDAKHYAKEAKHMKGKKKKEELVERKEAKSAAKDMKARAKKAHEY